jgi:hypothetical protein
MKATVSDGRTFGASILARLLATGEIAACGSLAPLTRVPDTLFLGELAKRGIKVPETITGDA